jgi:saccharopine dehydrogenase-like NADP-dependent oxidoreductase
MQRRSLRCRCESSGAKKRVVVLGGTGRVGSATAVSLIDNFSEQYEITVASRSQESFNKICELRPGDWQC